MFEMETRVTPPDDQLVAHDRVEDVVSEALLDHHRATNHIGSPPLASQ
jgi:hypothetical protein